MQHVPEKKQPLEGTTSNWTKPPPATEKQESPQHFFPGFSPHLTPPTLISLSPPNSPLPFYDHLPPPSLHSSLHQGHPAPQQPYHPAPFPHDRPSHSMPNLYPPADDNIKVVDLVEFAKYLKKERQKLGYSQTYVGLTIGRMYGYKLTAAAISQFERLNLSSKDMCKLKPLLQKWLQIELMRRRIRF